MSDHAFLAPSAAHRWSACPGSALMESRYPEQGDKQAAEEGTAAHWCMAQLFGGYTAATLLQDGKTESGHPVTREMVEGAQLLVDDVRETLAPFAVQPIVERRVNIPRVHPSANWGTPDVRAWAGYVAAPERFLFVWDYKHGHKHVEVFENKQLIDYAAGCLTEAAEYAKAQGAEPWPEERITIVLRVVQPRSYHRDGPIREWRIKAKDLEPHVFALSMAADAAMQPEPECRPVADACENCSARHACDALQRAAYRGMDLARQAQASDLTPAALGLELRYLTEASKLMEARLTGLAMQAESLIRQAVIVPHWTMQDGGARRKWGKPDAEIIALGDMIGVPLAKSPEPITPTQAKAAGLPEALLSTYSFTPPGAKKLALDDGSTARNTFTKLST